MTSIDGDLIARSTYGTENASLWQDYLDADRKQDQLGPTIARLDELVADGRVLEMSAEILFDTDRFVDAANVYTAAGHAAREARAADL